MGKGLILRIYFFALFFLYSAFPYSAYALEIYGYDPNRYDRFLPGTYGTSGAVSNPNFSYSSYDWSGVDWDTAVPSRSVALV